MANCVKQEQLNLHKERELGECVAVNDKKMVKRDIFSILFNIMCMKFEAGRVLDLWRSQLTSPQQLSAPFQPLIL